MSLKELSSESLAHCNQKGSGASEMNPVASGDNVVVSSPQSLKEALPALVPCCEGKELRIEEELVHSGLSAISFRHTDPTRCIATTKSHERNNFPYSVPGEIKHRNSFRCLHRPDLKRVPVLKRMSPHELELLFKGYAGTNVHHHEEAMPATGNKQHSCEKKMQNNIEVDKENINAEIVGEAAGPLRAGLARRSGGGAEDVPTGMKLHGARARLYTSVLAGARATNGDHLESSSHEPPQEVRPGELEDTLEVAAELDDEVLEPNSELHIILPPRDDLQPENPSTTTTYTLATICSNEC